MVICEQVGRGVAVASDKGHFLCEVTGSGVVGYKAEGEHVDLWLGQDPSVLYVNS